MAYFKDIRMKEVFTGLPVAIGAGTEADRRLFYTASILSPDLVDERTKDYADDVRRQVQGAWFLCGDVSTEFFDRVSKEWPADLSIRLTALGTPGGTYYGVVSQARVPASRVQEASEAVAKILVIGEAARQPARDPLREAVHAVRQAAKAVAEGHYGSAPPEGVRKSAVYAHWLELTNEVDGTARAGLLRQLQSAGWVKAKGA